MADTAPRWMIFGANGPMGQFVMEPATVRGHRPVAAGCARRVTPSLLLGPRCVEHLPGGSPIGVEMQSR